MTHSDDDGLVLPPRLAPRHVVIIPIFRGDDERAEVLGYCEKLKAEIEEQTFDHAKVRVLLDSRDIRGGEKVWQHIKKGVPVRLEVGPRDIASDSVFMGRRDCSPKDKSGVSRAEFVTQVPAILEEIQTNLYDRALAFRQERTRTIDSIDEFREFFTSGDDGGPAGGFALAHFVDNGGGDEILKELKVTPRCIPIEGDDEEGKCIFTGEPSTRRVVFAKAY
jgi:prolyl-tRNA synthetase